jgi:hypothetical protein
MISEVDYDLEFDHCPKCEPVMQFLVSLINLVTLFTDVLNINLGKYCTDRRSGYLPFTHQFS